MFYYAVIVLGNSYSGVVRNESPCRGIYEVCYDLTVSCSSETPLYQFFK